nr:MAG TPA: hypothetical protein [Caudoviricetes sp.]
MPKNGTKTVKKYLIMKEKNEETRESGLKYSRFFYA